LLLTEDQWCIPRQEGCCVGQQNRQGHKRPRDFAPVDTNPPLSSSLWSRNPSYLHENAMRIETCRRGEKRREEKRREEKRRSH
jgi:hypothetical protein